MKGTQSCDNCRFWIEHSDAAITDCYGISCPSGACRLSPRAVDKGAADWCGKWVAETPDTPDEAAMAMCNAYRAGDITLALAISDKLNELAGRTPGESTKGG